MTCFLGCVDEGELVEENAQAARGTCLRSAPPYVAGDDIPYKAEPLTPVRASNSLVSYCSFVWHRNLSSDQLSEGCIEKLLRQLSPKPRAFTIEKYNQIVGQWKHSLGDKRERKFFRLVVPQPLNLQEQVDQAKKADQATKGDLATRGNLYSQVWFSANAAKNHLTLVGELKRTVTETEPKEAKLESPCKITETIVDWAKVNWKPVSDERDFSGESPILAWFRALDSLDSDPECKTSP